MTPANRPDIKAAIQALVDTVLGERADRHLLLPTLIAAVSTEVNDFERYHPAEFAELRVKDMEILRQQPQFARQTKATA